MMKNSAGFRKLVFIILVLAAGQVLVKMPYVTSWGPGPNYNNFSVRTTVNVTEAYPEILNISCNLGQPITLTAGGTQPVVCIVQVRDYNGGDTINGTNGSGVFNSTFYYVLNQSSDPDDNNVHYTNDSCSLNGTALGFYVNWSCSFDVWYYANNGTWRVNATVLDTHNQQNLTTSAIFNSSISPLYALNVTDVIDYGSLFVGATSTDSVEANVTNFGNMVINVTVYGHGGDNATTGFGLAMVCEGRNLTVSNERFSINSTDLFDAMLPLASAAQMIPNLTIDKQTADGVLISNSTYWKLHINVSDNPFGVCNGTVVFSAVAN